MPNRNVDEAVARVQVWVDGSPSFLTADLRALLESWERLTRLAKLDDTILPMLQAENAALLKDRERLRGALGGVRDWLLDDRHRIDVRDPVGIVDAALAATAKGEKDAPGS